MSDQPQEQAATAPGQPISETPVPAADAAAEPRHAAPEDNDTPAGSADPEKAAQAEFPALQGQPGVEIAERQPDSDETGVFRKVFVLLKREYDKADESIHRRNYDQVLREAGQRGLHPTGEPSHDKDEDHDDGRSVLVHYTVPVEPAVTDHDPQNAVVPASMHEGIGQPLNQTQDDGSREAAE